MMRPKCASLTCISACGHAESMCAAAIETLRTLRNKREVQLWLELLENCMMDMISTRPDHFALRRHTTHTFIPLAAYFRVVDRYVYLLIYIDIPT